MYPASGVHKFSKLARLDGALLEPADCPGTETRQDDAPVMRGPENPVDAEPSPTAHQLQGVAAAHVDKVRRQNRLLELFSCRVYSQKVEHVRVAAELSAVYVLKDLVALGIRSLRWV